MRTITIATVAALLAAVITSAAQTRHPSSEGGGGGYWNGQPEPHPPTLTQRIYARYVHKHKRHHGTPATPQARRHLNETFATINAQLRQAYGQADWYRSQRLPTTATELWQMEHPDNIWMPYCYSQSYAVCGRDSAANHQAGGNQSTW